MVTEVRRTLLGIAFDPELTAGKMVFVAGPRQAGKTTLARFWLAEQGCAPLYFNWDDATVRRKWREDPHFFEPLAREIGHDEPWVVFDEIHKATRWRDMLKGWFDVFGREFRFLVTGSARLDLFRRGGDSLLGRYFLFHLFPLTFNELGERPELIGPERLLPESGTFAGDWAVSSDSAALFERYIRRGPFPEPLLADSDRFSRRWNAEYRTLLVRQDIRDLTRIAQLDRLEALVELLPGTVGSPLSYSSLARDLEVAHTTVKNWLEALRRIYLVFPVRPFARRVRRALRKDRKWYFVDWSHVPEEAARLENCIASALWQACHTWTDAGFGEFELRYLRTVDKREIDFVLLRDGEPRLAVEVKTNDTTPASTLRRRSAYFGADIPAVQVVGKPGIARPVDDSMWVVSADRFLRLLP